VQPKGLWGTPAQQEAAGPRHTGAQIRDALQRLWGDKWELCLNLVVNEFDHDDKFTPSSCSCGTAEPAFLRILAACGEKNPSPLGRSKWMKALECGVKYANESVRRKYQVRVGRPLTYQYGYKDRPEGQLFDTYWLWAKKRQGGKPLSGTTSGGGYIPNAKMEGRCIWVVTGGKEEEFALCSHTCKLNRFHHSSLTAGGDITAAGEWRVSGGVVETINGLSGHYRPEKWRLERILRWLTWAGVFADNAEVELFKNHKYSPVRVLDYLNSPGQFDEYRVAPF
jgi:hypothetical protein